MTCWQRTWVERQKRPSRSDLLWCSPPAHWPDRSDLRRSLFGRSLGIGLWHPWTLVVTYWPYFAHFFFTTLAIRTWQLQGDIA